MVLQDVRMEPSGLHHVTGITGDVQANVDFYVGLLGLRLVKRTVNHQDPATLHLFYGDAVGSPGTVLTFFADPGFDDFEMHRARAASAVLNIRLREILREEMGGTYGVGVGFSNTPLLKGYGTMVVQFGSAPENVDTMVAATLTV